MTTIVGPTCNVHDLGIAPRPTAFTGPVVLERRGIRTPFASEDLLYVALHNAREDARARAEKAARVLAHLRREAEWDAMPKLARLQFRIASMDPDYLLVGFGALMVLMAVKAGL